MDRLGGSSPGGSDAHVFQIFDGGAIPTSTPFFYSARPVNVQAADVEGATGVLSVESSAALRVAVIGPKIPVNSNFIMGHDVDFRWAADFLGPPPPTVNLPGCPCTALPTTLNMISSKPLSNNLLFQNATFVYGATPTSLAALSLGPNCFLSTAQFTSGDSPYPFWYLFECYLGYYVITRVYPVYTLGTPHQDIVRYRWLAGSVGNTCAPLSLANGTMYTGGDATCIVTITG